MAKAEEPSVKPVSMPPPLIRCMVSAVCFVMTILLIWCSPVTSADEKPETVYTIQIATYSDVNSAINEFDRLTEELEKEILAYLRIEKIGKYFTLRLGKFKDRADAERVSDLIRSRVSSRRIMDAYYIEKRIVEMYESQKGTETQSTAGRTGEKPLSGEVRAKVKPPASVRKIETGRDKMNKTDYSHVKLRARVPELCYNCHEKLKEGQKDKYVHFLFKEGRCITCHNSHISKIKALMVDEIDSLCKGCHEEIRDRIENSIVHGALREHDCTECHFAHSGENKNLLVEEEKSLCLTCHEDLKSKLTNPYICRPFKDGECSSCHDSHASPEDDLLISAPEMLCKKCHGPQCRAGKVSIASIVKNKDCTSCHSGHSSVDKGLLGPYGHKAFLDKNCEVCHTPIQAGRTISTKIEGSALCFDCHKRNESKYEYVDGDIHTKGVQNPCTVCHDHHASSQKDLTKKESNLCMECHESTERKTLAMERSLRTKECEPVRDRKCFECHIPGHSSRQFNYRSEEIPLCVRCHESQHRTTHPVGNDIIDPRSGRSLTCNSCHSMHSASADYMLTHDRKRALCIQCHKL